MSNDKSKRYNIAATVRKVIHAQAMLGHQDVVCSALLSRRGKKLNSIDRSPKENFTRLMHQYIQSEQPDKLRIELRSGGDALLWSKTFSFEVDPVEIPRDREFQGLGEAQIGELLNQKMTELRKQEELEQLRSETEHLSQENEALRRQRDGLEETVEAKKKKGRVLRQYPGACLSRIGQDAQHHPAGRHPRCPGRTRHPGQSIQRNRKKPTQYHY